jgi:hypothetical protein
MVRSTRTTRILFLKITAVGSRPIIDVRASRHRAIAKRRDAAMRNGMNADVDPRIPERRECGFAMPTRCRKAL